MKVGAAWRAASRLQKVTIAVALVLALGGVASLTTPAGSIAPDQANTALVSPTNWASLGATTIAAADTPTEPLASAPASNNPIATASLQATPTPTPLTATPKANADAEAHSEAGRP